MKQLKRLALALALVLAAGYVAAQTAYLPIPSGVGSSGQVLAVTADGNNVQGTSAPSFATSVTVGGGTAITKLAVYSATVSPPSMAANTCVEQAVSVSGLTTSDKLVVNPPRISGSATLVAARVSGADVAAFVYCNVAALSNQPAAGAYTIVALRS